MAAAVVELDFALEEVAGAAEEVVAATANRFGKSPAEVEVVEEAEELEEEEVVDAAFEELVDALLELVGRTLVLEDVTLVELKTDEEEVLLDETYAAVKVAVGATAVVAMVTCAGLAAMM